MHRAGGTASPSPCCGTCQNWVFWGSFSSRAEVSAQRDYFCTMETEMTRSLRMQMLRDFKQEQFQRSLPRKENLLFLPSHQSRAGPEGQNRQCSLGSTEKCHQGVSKRLGPLLPSCPTQTRWHRLGARHSGTLTVNFQLLRALLQHGALGWCHALMSDPRSPSLSRTESCREPPGTAMAPSR